MANRINDSHKTTHPDFDVWLTPQQAAEYVGVSVDYLERRRRSKEPPRFSKPSYKTVRYNKKDLDAWLESLVIEAGGE